jgi:hypothetical protein
MNNQCKDMDTTNPDRWPEERTPDFADKATKASASDTVDTAAAPLGPGRATRHRVAASRR